MEYADLLSQYNVKNYISNFQEAKRNFRWTYKIILSKNNIALSDVFPSLTSKKYEIGESVKIDSVNVFIEDFKNNSITIFYKQKDSFIKKTISLTNKKDKTILKYSEEIKMPDSPWGMSRIYIQKMNKRRIKKHRKDLLNRLNAA